ncbi:MAG: Flp family type IVb pilin [Salinarimonas sp.]|nr:Flp family type IVb pilin [Salinarimonas sp.]
MKALLARVASDDSGSTATEYAVIAVIMAIVVVAGARSVGAEVFDLYVFVSEQITVALQGNEPDP